jgi:aerobic-type carbon monoxide dehydrogenase small subunit (CoxS/CutS family)
MKYPLTVRVNGVEESMEIEPHRSLVDVLRNEVGVTGPKEGCDDSECGACMVLVDGKPVNACSYLAMQTDRREVTTIEGIGGAEGPDPIQRALLQEGGVQCGFCTPGMVISARALLDANPSCNEAEVRRALAGNLCRCTGYQKIIRAVLSAADAST